MYIVDFDKIIEVGLNVKVSKLVTNFICIFVFEWSMVKCRSNNRHHKII